MSRFEVVLSSVGDQPLKDQFRECHQLASKADASTLTVMAFVLAKCLRNEQKPSRQKTLWLLVDCLLKTPSQFASKFETFVLDLWNRTDASVARELWSMVDAWKLKGLLPTRAIPTSPPPPPPTPPPYKRLRVDSPSPPPPQAFAWPQPPPPPPMMMIYYIHPTPSASPPPPPPLPLLTNDDLFSTERLKQVDEGVIRSLYLPPVRSAGEGPRQCKDCGLRLPNMEAMAKHLDAHFKENQARSRPGQRSRGWVDSSQEWSADARTPPPPLPSATTTTTTTSKPSSRVARDDNHLNCALCREPFEMEWSHEDEEWMFENAIRRKETNDIVHVGCVSSSS
jgi:hypothetical protein